MALYSALEVQPLAAYFGGVVAQEVVKVTGKYSPLNQWLHLDFFEMLPEEFAEDGRGGEGEGSLRGGRYDHVVRLFGEKFFREKVLDAKTFMVCSVWCSSGGIGYFFFLLMVLMVRVLVIYSLHFGDVGLFWIFFSQFVGKIKRCGKSKVRVS